MEERDLLPAICAGLCCIGMWSPVAAAIGFGAHRRMVLVEREQGRAAPPNETALLFYALASIVWLSALVLAIAFLAKRSWARVGRNCTFILLGHFSILVTSTVVSFALLREQDPRHEVMRIAILACAMLGTSAITAAAMVWRWSDLRAVRIAAGAPQTMGAGEKLALYAGALVLWPVGLVASFVLNKPHNVHAAKVALRISVASLVAITLAVCAGFVALATTIEPQAL